MPRKQVSMSGKHTAGIKIIKWCIVLMMAGLIVFLVYIWNPWNMFASPSYRGADFAIETVYSSVDFNQNGNDDYTDFLLGAKEDAKNKPVYNGQYFEGGYPPDEIGVCTDVIWRAFRHAGYSLRDMVSADIAARQDAYPNIQKPDDNIDFRRVKNLKVFFETYAISLTLNPEEIAQWQPGDIVIYGDNKHIAMVSDLRNQNGVPYIIHNSGQPSREEDALTHMEITGHYRFDASRISPDDLIAWNATE